jgi:Ca-activated chloride channel family protein
MAFASLLLDTRPACYREHYSASRPCLLGNMPTFVHPWLLLLLLLAPLLLWLWLRRRHAALRYPETALLAQLPPGRSRIAAWTGIVLRTLAVVLLLVALAGPRWPDLRTRIPSEGIAIEMVLDVSGSMNEPDFIWQNERVTRLEAVKRVFRLFVDGGVGPGGEPLEGRGSDLVGLITFSERPDVVCPLTLSHSVLLGQLQALEPQAESTNIGDAIAWGLDRLRKASPQRKVLVLLTDGYHTVKDPQAWKPRPAAQVAANLPTPVVIYTIDAGRESGRIGETAADRKAAVQVLQDVARIAGGRYFRADDSPALLDACREIDRLERERIQSFQYRRYHEGYPWFGLASFALLVTMSLAEMTLWRRLP